MPVPINLSVLPLWGKGIFRTAGGVITRAEACNVSNLSTALFALYNLAEAFNASPATYSDKMCFFFFLVSDDAKNTAAVENSFKKKRKIPFAPTLDLNYRLESLYVSRWINVN